MFSTRRYQTDFEYTYIINMRLLSRIYQDKQQNTARQTKHTVRKTKKLTYHNKNPRMVILTLAPETKHSPDFFRTTPYCGIMSPGLPF